MQTTATTTQISNPSFAVTTQLSPANTALGNVTETTTSSELVVNTQRTSTPSGQLLVPAVILLVGLAVFSLLMFAGGRRKQRSTSSARCEQCGAELDNETYCTSCGAKRAT